MSRKKKAELGRALIKDRNLKKYCHRSSARHTSQLEDGQDFNRINFNSITEQSDVESFLATAELAGSDFKAEKLNVKFISPTTVFEVLSGSEKSKLKKFHDEHKSFLRIPRRPPWDRSMSPEELAQAEKDSFLEWRRSLGMLEQTEGLLMTPFEKNIEFWRQLWRVIERSDVLVQIVDARNPLLFYCEDLTVYVRDISPGKRNLLLVNKADFLTEDQREKWAKYFEANGIQAVFFSAIFEDPLESIAEDQELDVLSHVESNMNSNFDSDHSEDDLEDSDVSEDLEETFYDCVETLNDKLVSFSLTNTDFNENNSNTPVNAEEFINTSYLLTKDQLIEVFRSFHGLQRFNKHVTIGLVGYPNVGKSSTINRLFEQKKVSVSATPGKTKHFQTLFLDDDILLCDCPGLVFPAFVTSKEEMIIYGILPVDQMRDHVPPMNLVLSMIPRPILESKYGIRIPSPPEGDDPYRNPSSEEFLSAYGYMRGFMTPRGIPDHPRSARYVLKDFIDGRILYCHAPPTDDQLSYHEFVLDKVRKVPLQQTPQQLSVQPNRNRSSVIDASFFNPNNSSAHICGKKNMKRSSINGVVVEGLKPWRSVSKRNTRQKAKKKFAHLDK